MGAQVSKSAHGTHVSHSRTFFDLHALDMARSPLLSSVLLAAVVYAVLNCGLLQTFVPAPQGIAEPQAATPQHLRGGTAAAAPAFAEMNDYDQKVLNAAGV